MVAIGVMIERRGVKKVLCVNRVKGKGVPKLVEFYTKLSRALKINQLLNSSDALLIFIDVSVA
jgi:hypothetical protein